MGQKSKKYSSPSLFFIPCAPWGALPVLLEV